MTDYLITIPGDQAVWDARTEDENRAVGQRHHDFAERLVQRGHQVLGAAELEPVKAGRVVRRTANGYAVTEGPYTESVEQVGGYYVVASDDLEDLLDVCGYLAEIEPVVEVRPTLGHQGPS